MALAERDQPKCDRPSLTIGTKREHEAIGRLRYGGRDRHVNLRAGQKPRAIQPMLLTSTQWNLRARPFDLRTGSGSRRPRRTSLTEAVNLLQPDILVESKTFAIDQDVGQASALPVTGKAPKLRLDLLLGSGPRTVAPVEL